MFSDNKKQTKKIGKGPFKDIIVTDVKTDLYEIYEYWGCLVTNKVLINDGQGYFC